MQDVKTSFEVDGITYPLVFNLNVMESIQAEYGSIDAWGDLTDGEAYQIREFLARNPDCDEFDWADLPDEEKAKYKGEPDARAVKFGYKEMINEGIDMENEEKGENKPMLSPNQVGRLLTKYGLANATKTLNKTVVESTQTDIKNV